MTSKTGSRLREPDPVDGSALDPSGTPTRADRAAAKVQPLDVTGVRTVAVGTGLWLVALLVLIPFYGTLRDQGRGWWFWMCVAGLVLGLGGLEYCRRRRSRLAGEPDREVETSPLGAAGL